MSSKSKPQDGQGATVAFAVPAGLIDAVASRVVDIAIERGLLAATPAPPLLTVDEAAAYLRCSKQAVYDRVHQGALKPLRDGKRLLFSRAAVDAYLEGRAG